jgi:hypothetical protein
MYTGNSKKYTIVRKIMNIFQVIIPICCGEMLGIELKP